MRFQRSCSQLQLIRLWSGGQISSSLTELGQQKIFGITSSRCRRAERITRKQHQFENCLKWWKRREENERAWKISAKDALKYDSEGNLISVNLDSKNPRAKQDIAHLPPERLQKLFHSGFNYGKLLRYPQSIRNIP
jgi:hypothetical protein